jgi:hypothetical protein
MDPLELRKHATMSRPGLVVYVLTPPGGFALAARSGGLVR